MRGVAIAPVLIFQSAKGATRAKPLKHPGSDGKVPIGVRRGTTSHGGRGPWGRPIQMEEEKEMDDRQALKEAITVMMNNFIQFERAKNQLNAGIDMAYEEYKENIDGIPKSKKLLKAIAKAMADGKAEEMRLEAQAKEEIIDICQEAA